MAKQQKLTCFMVVDGEECEVELPSKFVVCSRCEGRGTHVNPAIDGNGLTRDDFDEDPDFEESYFRGDYDIACQTCDGLRVVVVLDRQKATKAQRKAYDRQREDEAEVDAMQRAERMAELGWHGYHYG